MTFIITVDVVDSYSPDEFTDDVMDMVEKTFEQTDVSRVPVRLEIPVGTFEFEDGSITEFRDYQVTAVSAFRNQAGDRWFGTADGGLVNVSKIVRDIRKVVLDARADTE